MLDYAAVAALSFDEFRARVWAAWSMVAGVRLGWGVAEKGYVAGFLPEQLRPVLDRGWRNVLIHRPLGDDSAAAGEVMNEDAAVENRDPKARDFDDMLAAVEKTDPEAVFMAYLGSWQDPDFGRQLSAGKFAAWIDRKRRSVLPALDRPNADVAYDHSATMSPQYEREQGGSIKGFPPGSWRLSWAWLGLVTEAKRMQGRTVWIEALPHRASIHQHHCCCLCRTFEHNGGIQREWDRSRPIDDQHFPGFADSDWAAPSQRLTGRVLDLNTILGRDPLALYAAEIALVLARGPRFEWAGSLSYLSASALDVYRAVVAHAAEKAPSA